MLEPVGEFQVDAQSQETSGNTSKAPRGDLWKHTSRNSDTVFCK